MCLLYFDVYLMLNKIRRNKNRERLYKTFICRKLVENNKNIVAENDRFNHMLKWNKFFFFWRKEHKKLHEYSNECLDILRSHFENIFNFLVLNFYFCHHTKENRNNCHSITWCYTVAVKVKKKKLIRCCEVITNSIWYIISKHKLIFYSSIKTERNVDKVYDVFS